MAIREELRLNCTSLKWQNGVELVLTLVYRQTCVESKDTFLNWANLSSLRWSEEHSLRFFSRVLARLQHWRNTKTVHMLYIKYTQKQTCDTKEVNLPCQLHLLSLCASFTPLSTAVIADWKYDWDKLLPFGKIKARYGFPRFTRKVWSWVYILQINK